MAAFGLSALTRGPAWAGPGPGLGRARGPAWAGPKNTTSRHRTMGGAMNDNRSDPFSFKINHNDPLKRPMRTTTCAPHSLGLRISDVKISEGTEGTEDNYFDPNFTKIHF